jgi:ClpP class serine protease
MIKGRRYIHLADILSTMWFINPDYAVGYFPVVHQMMEGNAIVSTDEEKEDIEYGLSYALQEPQSETINVYRISDYGTAAPPEGAPKNSVAVLPIRGVMTKYDQYCGPSGMETKRSLLERCLNNPNIVAVVFDIDSGGGQAAESLYESVRNSDKPVMAYINGWGCSAAYWLAASCTEIFMSGKMSTAGSIGAFIEYADFTEYYKQKGITIRRTYAPQSNRKNKSYEDLLEGDDTELKKELEKFTQIFIDDIKSQRQIKDDKKVFAGQHYLSQDAIDINLADKIGSLDDAIVRAYELSKQSGKNKSNSQNKNTMSLLNKYPKLSALEGKASSEITTEMIEEANAELIIKGIKSVELVSKSSIEEMENKINAGNTERATIKSENDELQKKVTALEEKVKTLGNADGAGAVETGKKNDEITEDPAKAAQQRIANRPHAKAAGEAIS